MDNTIVLDHIALTCRNKEHVRIFYEVLLQCRIVKSFVLTHDLSQQIFHDEADIEVMVYEGMNYRFEIFLTDSTYDKGFDHICFKIDDRKAFIDKCNMLDVDYFTVEKGEKTLLFIKDFSGNLFEIKST